MSDYDIECVLSGVRHNCTVPFKPPEIPGPLDTSRQTDLDDNDPDTVSPLNVVVVVAADNDCAGRKMPHSFGYRARTRDMFKRGFKSNYPALPA